MTNNTRSVRSQNRQSTNNVVKSVTDTFSESLLETTSVTPTTLARQLLSKSPSRQVAEFTGISVRTVQKYRSILRDRGLLTV